MPYLLGATLFVVLVLMIVCPLLLRAFGMISSKRMYLASFVVDLIVIGVFLPTQNWLLGGFWVLCAVHDYRQWRRAKDDDDDDDGKWRRLWVAVKSKLPKPSIVQLRPLPNPSGA